MAEWKQAAEAGAGLVELRIDCLRRDPDLKRIFKEKPTPVVFTIRRGDDGGLWRGDEERRQRLLREAIVLGVDYVDLEVDIAEKIPRPKFGKTKRIISYHNFRRVPDDLESITKKMSDFDPDVIKVAVLVRTPAEASAVLDVASKSTSPMIAIAMGPAGSFTRVLGAKYGAPFTYAGFNPDRIFAPGMLQLGELKHDYFYDEINSETKVFAVIGDPIAQSLSPAVHNAAFRHAGLNSVLVPILIPRELLKPSLSALEWLDIQGMSVTIPHKEAVVAMLSARDKAVERTDACNTLLRKDRQWIGHNTDYRAAIAALELALGGSPDAEVSPLMDKQVLILGAGGVARSIAFGAASRGAGVAIANRNDERALKLAEDVGCRAVTWSMRASSLCDIIINCTPVGMHPDVDSSPVPAAAFKPGMVAFDTVYHPEHTMFLKLAREHECGTVSGVDMFVYQAALQFHYYANQDAPIELMREVVRKKLSPTRA